jgi:hypothetical protein
VNGLSDYVRIEEIHFAYIRRRMIRVKPLILEMDFVNDNDNGKEEEPITLIVDASGLTVSRKGHYIGQKPIRKKKEFIKLHVAVDAKSKKVSSLFSNN